MFEVLILFFFVLIFSLIVEVGLIIKIVSLAKEIKRDRHDYSSVW